MVLNGLATLTVAAVAFWAAWSLPDPDQIGMSHHRVRLVQPNAPQNEKWLPQRRWDFFERQLEYTAAEGEVDLVVWPETAVPSLLNYAEGFVPAMQQAARGVPVLYGIQREQAGEYFNSAVVMDERADGLDIYDKMHLVPFGEYMPLSDLAARFGVFGLAARANAGYAPGTQRRLLDLSVGRALPLICYEAVFGQDVNATPERPDLLVLITNDAWFGLNAGPQQHLLQAQMRAAEQGLPMVRVANTGISAMIDPYGRLRERLALNTAGFVDGALPRPLAPTLYSRVGDWPVFLLSVLCVGLAVLAHRRSYRSRPAQKPDEPRSGGISSGL